jgi:hypothetical protein
MGTIGMKAVAGLSSAAAAAVALTFASAWLAIGPAAAADMPAYPPPANGYYAEPGYVAPPPAVAVPPAYPYYAPPVVVVPRPYPYYGYGYGYGRPFYRPYFGYGYGRYGYWR